MGLDVVADVIYSSCAGRLFLRESTIKGECEPFTANGQDDCYGSLLTSGPPQQPDILGVRRRVSKVPTGDIAGWLDNETRHQTETGLRIEPLLLPHQHSNMRNVRPEDGSRKLVMNLGCSGMLSSGDRLAAVLLFFMLAQNAEMNLRAR
jgi:hypothetical protein